MERTWGELHRYRGIRTDGNGASVVSGVRLGKVFLAVQPLLGLEGDPMRLLFERDLTPHPQVLMGSLKICGFSDGAAVPEKPESVPCQRLALRHVATFLLSSCLGVVKSGHALLSVSLSTDGVFRSCCV
jgi:hypothetical protein